MLHQRIRPRGWTNCIVAATGPSLTPEVAEACRGRVIAVNDAYRLFPGADIIYAADAAWWKVHDGCAGHPAEKWTTRNGDDANAEIVPVAERYGLNVITGQAADGFSFDPARLHFGNNSGFQAINLALLFGARVVVLVGFNMRVAGRRHFFGDHPEPLRNESNYERWVPNFEKAAKMLPADRRIINATPDSALTCFERMDLHDALSVAAEGGRHTGVAGPDRPDHSRPAHVA